MKILSRLLPLSLFAPLFAFAQGAGNFQQANSFINNLLGFVNTTIVPAIFALAFLVFLWGMFQTFIVGGHDEEKQAAGKQLMMYSIAGFVLMVSIWGIVNLVSNSFGLKDQNIQNIPNLPKR